MNKYFISLLFLGCASFIIPSDDTVMTFIDEDTMVILEDTPDNPLASLLLDTMRYLNAHNSLTPEEQLTQLDDLREQIRIMQAQEINNE